MPRFDNERRRAARDLQQLLAVENTLTFDQARSFVRGLLVAWNERTIRWDQNESAAQMADARRLLQAAETLRTLDGSQSADAILCYRRAAELLEWLSRAEDDLRNDVPLELLAACAYQLGGLPAMSAALLNQSTSEHAGVELYSRFLRSDFDGVVRASMKFWRENNELTTPAGSNAVLTSEDTDRVDWYFTAELVRSVGLIADALRTGSSVRINQGVRKLQSLDAFASRNLSPNAALVVTLMRQVAESFASNNIYAALEGLIERDRSNEAKFRRYARGQFSLRRGILWTSQLTGIERLVEQDSFALCTPTGSGKTLIANLALLKELLTRAPGAPVPLALYLVPSRALAGEVEAKLSNELGSEFIITGLYGGADWGVTDYWLTADQPTVLIATVEKADALVRYLGPILRSRLKLLIIDEAHQVVPDAGPRLEASFAEHQNRAIRLEGFVARLLTLVPDVVRIALTAVAGGAANPVARWIEGRADAEAVGTRYRSTRQLIGVLETEPDRPCKILLDIMNGKPLFVRGRDQPVFIPLRSPPMPTPSATVRGSVNRVNQLQVLWAALHLKNERQRILISIAQEPEQTMKWFAEALSLPAWSDVAAFDRPTRVDGELYDRTRAACIDYCGAGSFEAKLLDCGIATSHGQMPQRLRRLMTSCIERGICPVTLATATLTEGVNLPFDIIFVPSLKRTSFDRTAQRQTETPLSTAEFRNLSGRAGRPGAAKGMEGLTLVALPRSPSSTAPAQQATQRSQIRGLANDFENLRSALLLEETDSAAVASPLAALLQSIANQARTLLGIGPGNLMRWLDAVTPDAISADAGRADPSGSARLADSVDELDAFLLSALEEVNAIILDAASTEDAETRLAAVWSKTFTAVAATQEAWMEQAFIRRGKAIIETIYPDANERKKLYQYGLSPHVGRRFDAVVGQLREALRNATVYGTASAAERFQVLASLAEPLVNDTGFGFRVRQTVTDTALLRDWRDVLSWWVQAGAAGPDPTMLRSWQRFVSDNIDFRLGVGVGAVVANAWADGTADPLSVPSLDAWRQTTGFPWFAFWARELLRWGTMEPFVAFALAQGLVNTREDGTARKSEFDDWLRNNRADIEPDDWIDPQLFLRWQNSLPRPAAAAQASRSIAARLTGASGEASPYAVVPLIRRGQVYWMDAAGYSLAQSDRDPDDAVRARDDFELKVDSGVARVRRIYRARSIG